MNIICAYCEMWGGMPKGIDGSGNIQGNYIPGIEDTVIILKIYTI